MKKNLMAVLVLCAWGGPAFAGIVTQTVDYKDGGAVLEGYLAYDDSIQGKRPGILVVHEWNGPGHYVEGRCRQLAQLGYVAFAADIYGKGVRPQSMQDCQKESSKYKSNRALMRERARAALSQLQNNERVDASKIAVIGYCFGGTVALELGRGGAPVLGIVSFHGGLDTPTPADAQNIKGKVLVCQGGADSHTLSQIPGFEKEMKDAKVDYKIITYPGATHGFTNPDNKGPALKYDPQADKDSWRAMRDFFDRIFKS